MDFFIAVLDEQGDDLGVLLNQLHDVGVIRSLRHADTLLGLFANNRDLVGLAEHLGEQWIATMDRLVAFDPFLQRRHMFLNQSGEFWIVGFGQRLDSVVGLLTSRRIAA